MTITTSDLEQNYKPSKEEGIYTVQAGLKFYPKETIKQLTSAVADSVKILDRLQAEGGNTLEQTRRKLAAIPVDLDSARIVELPATDGNGSVVFTFYGARKLKSANAYGLAQLEKLEETYANVLRLPTKGLAGKWHEYRNREAILELASAVDELSTFIIGTKLFKVDGTRWPVRKVLQIKLRLAAICLVASGIPLKV